MCKEEHTPVSTDQPTVFVSNHGAAGTIDVEPFLEALSMYGCDGMAQNIDSAMHDLTRLYLEHGQAYNTCGDVMYALRILRNAVLKGGGYFDFPKQ